MNYQSSRLATASERRQRPAKGGRGHSQAHDSAHKHVTGEAQYIDDMPELARTLHVAVGKSQISCGTIRAIDLTAVRAAEGVVDVVTLNDVPGEKDIGPVFKGDPLLADGRVEFHGQPIFAVAAHSFEQAKRAVQLAQIDYQEETPTLTIADALRQNAFVRPAHTMQKGDVTEALSQAPKVLHGSLYNKGQEHFYLEGQVSYVVPVEDGGMKVYTSSQHPSEVQKLVAEVLDLPINLVQTEVRRMGGGFGGKETQAAPWACLAAVFANRLKRPIKIRLDRQDDMQMTGKRHDFSGRYQVGFDEQGKLLAADIELAGKCGFSPDLSDAIVDRAMFHIDNAYHYPAMRVIGHRCKTNTVSNTAFRGFGGPQGMLIGEGILDDVARAVGRDPLQVRLENIYQTGQYTHYGQCIEHFPMAELMTELAQQSRYEQRREAITDFNNKHRFRKRGLALTPVKFGISFTVQFLNQAGALVHIYTDGSIHVNHGGTEMGQGLFIKVAQIVASEFDVDIDTVQVSATATDKVPNTSPTAASSGTDLNGKAAQNACLTIKSRLLDFAEQHYGVSRDALRFEQNHLVVQGDSEQWVAFSDFIMLAYQARVSLSSTGFYSTPKIHYDRDSATGRPFFYYALGASCSEVEVDTLTGEYQIIRTDILHDAGRSLNPAIDIGQIEGGFVQGMGWLTTEELSWDDEGRLTSNAAANYKIPTSIDVPELQVTLWQRDNEEDTIYRSKAVGEPPLMHGISVWCALRDAAASVANYQINPPLDTPATPERVLAAIHYCQEYSDEHGC